MSTNISIIPSTSVNQEKWDEKVRSASNGFIYATTAYLNAIAKNWDALIINDYELIMPIPWRIKAGIKYVFTPEFTQQLGLIGNIQDNTNKEILRYIKSKFKYGSFLLNNANNVLAKEIGAVKKLNLVLSLQPSFNAIVANFKENHQQSIKKSLSEQLYYQQAASIEKSILLYKQLNGHKIPHIKDADYNGLCKYASQQITFGTSCFARNVLNEKGEVLATNVSLQDSKRVYNIINCTTAEGKIKKANHYLYYKLIEEFATQNLLLDFEGSSLPGVKAFYESFGAKEEWYYLWHYNALPFPLSLIP